MSGSGQELCVLPTVPGLGHVTLLVTSVSGGSWEGSIEGEEVWAEGSTIQLANGVCACVFVCVEMIRVVLGRLHCCTLLLL